MFLIQNTQNRDTDILHLKIDELLRVTKEAQNAMLGARIAGPQSTGSVEKEISQPR
ncbi:low affinity Fe/Cu permease [Pseudomonas sp. GGS8]|nr:low affinity Fe/Cu permease [Pseudomonas sp. GGS8]